MRSLSSSIVHPQTLLGAVGPSSLATGAGAARAAMTIDAIERRQRSQAADRLRAEAPGLRSRLHRAPRGEVVEQFREILRRQILVIIVVDLHHRRVATGAQALHFDPREGAVGRDPALRSDNAPT